MAQRERGLKLRCRDGHFEMVEFELKRQDEGFWMWVECDFQGHEGGHWIAPDVASPQFVVVATQPYVWPSASEAFAARDRWEAQQPR